jgi:hypothetical protein
MPGMLAMDHVSIVDALQYGTARNQTTWAAALAAIGATPAILVLAMAGDGVWTTTSSFASPANVTTLIPPGVTVNLPSGVTWTSNGVLVTFNPSWQTGLGVVQRGVANAVEISSLRALQMIINFAGEGLRVANPTTGAYVSLLTNTGLTSNLPVIQFVQQAGVNASNWEIGNYLQSSVYEWYVARPGGLPHLAMNNTGLWISNGSSYTSPTHLLELQSDSASKPGTNTWTVFPSNGDAKTVRRPFEEGLAALEALPASVVFVYNERAGVPLDDTEHVGMVAEEVQAVAPYMVVPSDRTLDAADPNSPPMLGFNNGAMVYMLINAVKELSARLQVLEHASVGTTQRATPAATPSPPEAAAKKRSR